MFGPAPIIRTKQTTTMSRFKDYSPRVRRRNSSFDPDSTITPATRPEISESVTGSSTTSRDSSQILEAHNDNATPWGRLKRLANVVHTDFGTPIPRIASSSNDSVDYSRSPDSLHSISRSLQKIRRDSPIPDPTRPNRTLFTPEKPNLVADGYISPPESRQVSPDLPKVRVVADSPTPLSRPTLLSPKSRITRTLQEIQAELADSREGIESIESRLEFLEKHDSVSPENIAMHVQDCIQDMADELVEDDTELVMQLPISPRTLLLGILGVLILEYLVLSMLREVGRQRILFS